MSAWNLRQGFTAYLQARDIERLDQLTDIAGGGFARPAARTSPVHADELAVLEGGGRLLAAEEAPQPQAVPRRAPDGSATPAAATASAHG